MNSQECLFSIFELIFNYQYLFLIKIQNNGGTINEYYNLNENTELVYMKVTSAIMRLINTCNNNVAARLLVLIKTVLDVLKRCFYILKRNILTLLLAESYKTPNTKRFVTCWDKLYFVSYLSVKIRGENLESKGQLATCIGIFSSIHSHSLYLGRLIKYCQEIMLYNSQDNTINLLQEEKNLISS